MIFKYSAYWGTWNRVLQYQSGNWVEIDLTGVNGEWDRVKTENIRAHITALGKGDVLQGTLPLSVFNNMKVVLGEELAEKLVYFDYLPLIDFNKYHKACNGGATFEDIRK